MSNLEWMQRQHYESWRKILMDDPYQAIFGSSNARLSGKGLTDWEWINKSFPKWMLREIDSHEELGALAKRDHDATSDSNSAKKVGVRIDDADIAERRVSHFSQPSYKATRPDSGVSSGIMYLRRSHEQSNVEVVGSHPEADVITASKTSLSSSTSSETPPPTLPKSTASFRDFLAKIRSDAATEMEKSNKTAATAEPLLMDQTHTDKSQVQNPHTSDKTGSDTWRQTVLQRRLSPGGTDKPNSGPAPMIKTRKETPWGDQFTEETYGIPCPIKVEAHSSVEAAEVKTNGPTDFEHSLSSSGLESGISTNNTAPLRSTRKILSQLPEDDIDFLSADAIRASMAARKSKISKDEQKEAERHNLEKTFEDVHKMDATVDPMVESKVINDQLVRRIEARMQGPQDTPQVDKAPKATSTEKSNSAEELTLESSVDRMKRWLERGGATFSSIFWQDPAEEPDVEKVRLFFDRATAHIRKSRLTMKQVVEDLETDIPASKPLLKRLKADEKLLDSAIHAFRQRSGSGKMQPLTPNKNRAVQQLRLKYRDTDRELDNSYAKLRELSKTEAAKSASPALKRRLSIAAKITQKNAHLMRYLIWSLQARLEDPNIDPSTLPNYQAVANSLLALRDTQLALSRLVERAMLVYNVVPKTIEDIDILCQKYGVEVPTQSAPISQPPESTGMSEVDKAQLRAKIAADERLANEVDAQKLAMRGLSDDGYARASKPVIKTSFEERGPLAHSLFRPFGPVLESLSSGTAAGAEAKKAEEEPAQKQHDATLVAEVEQAYEDSYEPITVGHVQLPDAAEEVRKGQESKVQKFDMLKDDPSSEAVADSANPTTSKAKFSGPYLDDYSYGTSELREKFDVCTKDHSSGVSAVPVTATASEEKFSVPGVNKGAPHNVLLHGTAGQRMDSVPKAQETHKVIQGVIPSTRTPNITAQAAEFPESPATSSLSASINLPTHYTILIHDPQTDKLSLTTSTTGPPRDTSPVLPLHLAFSALDQPAKFIPYISEGLEAVTAKKDMLVLRDALDPGASSTKPFVASSAPKGNLHVLRNTVNPIDGTTRLSPTGYASPEESEEQLKQEFDGRREMARAFAMRKDSKRLRTIREEHERERGKGERRGRRAAGVIKTAIWTAAGCYVVGVLGELAGGA
jgi:hypothetical protein